MRTSAPIPSTARASGARVSCCPSSHHPNIIPIYGVGEIDGELYIASRLVSSTLRNRILAGSLSVDESMKVLVSVASALDAAHALGIVHRDIKPANVLMDPGPQVFLGDFGLARDNDGQQLTAPGQVLGTIDYMAPELLDGDNVGPATDIYGLACLAYETLTGTVPYLRETDAATMYAHIVDPPPSVSERRPELPAALDRRDRRRDGQGSGGPARLGRRAGRRHARSPRAACPGLPRRGGVRDVID